MNHINSILRPLYNYSSPLTLVVGSLITATALFAIGRIALAYKNSKFIATSDRIWCALYVGLMGSAGQARINHYKVDKYRSQLDISEDYVNPNIANKGLTYKTSDGRKHRIDGSYLYPLHMTKQISLNKDIRYSQPPIPCNKKIPLYNDNVIRAYQNNLPINTSIVNLECSGGRGWLDSIFYSSIVLWDNTTVLIGTNGCEGFAPRKIDGKEATTEETKAYLGSVVEQILAAYQPFKEYLNLAFAIETKNPKDNLIFTTFEKAINEYNLRSNT